jgi:integrase
LAARGKRSRTPQRPAGRDLLAVPLRRAASSRARRGDREGAGHSAQTPRQGAGHLAHRARAGALLAAPDRSTWAGRRDHALILLAAQTGLRISELTELTISDIHLGTGPHVSCHGKGRKDRITPLTALKERALARTTPPDVRPGLYQPPDQLLALLDRSDYADLPATRAAAASGSTGQVGIIPRSA